MYEVKKCDIKSEECQYHPDLPQFKALSNKINLEIAEQVLKSKTKDCSFINHNNSLLTNMRILVYPFLSSRSEKSTNGNTQQDFSQ